MKRCVLLSLLTLVGCSSTPKHATEPTSERSKGVLVGRSVPATKTNDDENIDFAGLQHSLGLDRADDDLGFREQAFNSCQVGYGYSSSGNCRSISMVVLNLCLLCRPTEDTDSTILTAADLSPIASRDVTWRLKSASGTVRTDGSGFFQIRTVLPGAAKAERMRLTVGNDFLVMRAGEMSRLVTPKSWCP